MDVISIQADLFTVNTNRNTAKDALQVSTMQSASLVLHTKYLLISSRVKYPHLSASFVFHVYTREGLALGMRILSHQQLLSILEIGRYARVCSYRPFTHSTWQNIAYCSSCMVCIYSSGSCKNCRFR